MNEAQRHLMRIAATNPFLLVQLSPVSMHLKGRRDFEAKRELEFVDADDLDSLWLQLGYLEFVDANDDSRRVRFRITPKM